MVALFLGTRRSQMDKASGGSGGVREPRAPRRNSPTPVFYLHLSVESRDPLLFQAVDIVSFPRRHSSSVEFQKDARLSLWSIVRGCSFARVVGWTHPFDSSRSRAHLAIESPDRVHKSRASWLWSVADQPTCVYFWKGRRISFVRAGAVFCK